MESFTATSLMNKISVHYQDMQKYKTLLTEILRQAQ